MFRCGTSRQSCSKYLGVWSGTTDRTGRSCDVRSISCMKQLNRFCRIGSAWPTGDLVATAASFTRGKDGHLAHRWLQTSHGRGALRSAMNFAARPPRRNVTPPDYGAGMDDNTLHGDGGLFPELTASEPALPRWEVTFRVRRDDSGEPLKPLGVSSEGHAIACWTAMEGVAFAIVDATDEMAARAAGALACPGWAKLPGAGCASAPCCHSIAQSGRQRGEPTAR
jgi:hypothetical protein